MFLQRIVNQAVNWTHSRVTTYTINRGYSTAAIAQHPPKRSVTIKVEPAWFLKQLGRASVAAAIAAGAFVLGGSYYADMPPHLFLKHTGRFWRAAWCGLVTTVDYKISFWGLERGTPEYNAKQPSVNRRTANRLLKLCRKNRGVFIKAGQYVASLNNILPTEFTTTLSALQDKADFTPFKNVEKVFLQDLGKHPDEVFSEFERTPIAAASLAQVHIARRRDTGEKLAVKVQYSDMNDMFRGDMFTITTVMRFIGYFFPHFQFSWVLPEFNQSLKEELDFINEGRNAEKTANFFKDNERVHVPRIHWDLSSKRILAMEFCEGIKINDIEGLKNAGLNTHEVAKTLIEVFSDQIFSQGEIHADPHPGNILVRKTPKGVAQLVILDHGLYKTLPDDIRQAYCYLWKALILRDKKGIEKYGRMLGAGDYYNLLSIILTYRPLENQDVGFKQNLTAADWQNIRSAFKGAKTWQDSVKIVNNLLESVPREILFILRTTNLLRSINKDLGATVNRFMVMAERSLRGIYRNHDKVFSEWIRYKWTLLEFKIVLAYYSFARWFMKSLHSLFYVVLNLYAP